MANMPGTHGPKASRGRVYESFLTSELTCLNLFQGACALHAADNKSSS